MIGSPNFESMHLLKAQWLLHFSEVNLYSHNSHLQKDIDYWTGCLNWNTPRDMNLLWGQNMSSVWSFIRREIRKLETFSWFLKPLRIDHRWPSAGHSKKTFLGHYDQIWSSRCGRTFHLGIHMLQTATKQLCIYRVRRLGSCNSAHWAPSYILVTKCSSRIQKCSKSNFLSWRINSRLKSKSPETMMAQTLSRFELGKPERKFQKSQRVSQDASQAASHASLCHGIFSSCQQQALLTSEGLPLLSSQLLHSATLLWVI